MDRYSEEELNKLGDKCHAKGCKERVTAYVDAEGIIFPFCFKHAQEVNNIIESEMEKPYYKREIEGQLKNIIYVPGRLINFVTTKNK